MSFFFEGEAPPPAPPPSLQETLLQDLLRLGKDVYDKYPNNKNYLLWLDYCVKNDCKDISRVREIELEHRLRLDCPPGTLGLMRGDYEELVDLLRSNDGSKECLLGISRFCRDCAHSAYAIGLTFTQFVQRAIDSCESFNKVYHAVLAINELLSYPGLITTRGPYTHALTDSTVKPVSFVSLLWPHLVFILYLVYRATNLLVEKDKLVELLDFWVSKELISRHQFESLRSTMMNERLKLPEPPAPTLISPCVDLRAKQMKDDGLPSQSASHTPVSSLGDLDNVSVGRMADIARARLRLGAERYDPLDLNMNPALVNLPGEVRNEEIL